MGYYFYFPPENKIVVARYAEFFEKLLISQEISGRTVDLEEIHKEEDTTPSEITSNIPQEVKGFEPPQEEVIPIRRSNRTHRAPNRLCLNVEVEEHSTRDLMKPTSYKAAMLGFGINKWIQQYYDYEIWQMDVKTACLKMVTLMKTSIWCNLKVLLILIIPGKYASFKDPFMVLSKHQEAGIKDLTRKSKGLDLLKILMSHVYIKRLVGVMLHSNPCCGDIIIMGNHIPSLQSVKDYLGKCFAMKDLGEAAFILGIKIYRDRSKRLIGLCQNAYMDKILKRYKMDNSKRGHIPMQERLDLNKSQGAQTPKELISTELGELHWTAVKNILKYLRNTEDMFLVYGGNPSTELRVDCYCDAGFETDRYDTKSQTGYVFVLNGGAVDWKSSKQSTIAMSATESEYIAASEAAMEAVWIRKFISGLGIVTTINQPINMYCDNSAVVHYANEPEVQKGVKH
ncbi:retrotransposon protein, putative, ty1-copia subclass [Tanacetum coccineum]